MSKANTGISCVIHSDCAQDIQIGQNRIIMFFQHVNQHLIRTFGCTDVLDRPRRRALHLFQDLVRGQSWFGQSQGFVNRCGAFGVARGDFAGKLEIFVFKRRGTNARVQGRQRGENGGTDGDFGSV
eukprot:693256-Prorocentrum_minimum.AAC.42